MTLTEFLLARIAEDESRALAVKPLVDVRPMGAVGYDEKTLHLRRTYAGEDGYPRTVADPEAEEHYSRHDPARVLAECAAKRRMVEEWQAGVDRLDDQGRPAHLFDPAASMLLKSHAGWLRILASVYSDHPDFDPAWRP